MIQVELNDMVLRSIEKAHEALHGRTGPVPFVDGDLIASMVDRLDEAIEKEQYYHAMYKETNDEANWLERANSSQDGELSRIRGIVAEAIEMLEQSESVDKLVVKVLCKLEEI